MLPVHHYDIRHRLYELRRLALVFTLLLALFSVTQWGLDRHEGHLFSWNGAAWLPVIGRYALACLLFNILISLARPKADQTLFPIVSLLGGLSLVMLYRLPTPFWDAETGRIAYATRNMWYVERQALFLMAGQGVMLLLLLTPAWLHWLRQHRAVTVALGLGLLLATALFGVEATAGGPRVSLNFGLFQFQPAELIKLLFVLYLASYLRLIRPDLQRFTYRPLRVVPLPHISQLRPIFLVLLSALTFLVWMSDLGAALMLILIFPAMLYTALPRRVFWYLVALAGLIAYLLLSGVNWLRAYGQEPLSVTTSYPSLLEIAPVRINDGLERLHVRLDNMRDPWKACTEANGCASYQTLHAIYALAAGGLVGTGPGAGLSGNIPFVHTDMIYAAIGEEWGLLGAGMVLFLYWWLIKRALLIARAQTDPFPAFLGGGIATVFTLQVFIIIGGTINILPLTGITVPFLSYGGTSILVNSFMIGLLLALSAAPAGGEPSREIAESLLILQSLYGISIFLLLLGTAYWSVWMHVRLSPAFPRQNVYSANPVAWQREAAWLARVDRGRILAANGSVLAANGVNGRDYHLPSGVHVLGQADARGQGLSGLERVYNDTLLGKGRYDLKTLQAQWFDGEWQGNDLVLTLDPRWQQAAHEGLGGYNGAIVVLDAKTGAVLAMVSHPLYDPTKVLNQASLDAINATWDTPFLNRAIQGLYPPGSTFKTVTGAAAIVQDLVTPTTPFDFSRDIWYMENGRLCHKQWVSGAIVPSCNSDQMQMSFAEGFAFSDNVLFAQLAVQVGAQAMWNTAAGFGFGQPIPFDLPTAASQVAQDAGWLNDPAQLAMTGFGQSRVTATPLQMALVAAAIANDGKLPTPYLVSEVLRPDGKVLERTRPSTWQRTLTHSNAAVMYGVMVQSVETGWAGAAAVEGAVVGGKTGTAEWSGTPQGQLPHSWFIGFAEMPDGQTVAFAVLVEAGGEGSLVAAPIAGYILGQVVGW